MLSEKFVQHAARKKDIFGSESQTFHEPWNLESDLDKGKAYK